MALRFVARTVLPEGSARQEQLQYYASQFMTAELNGVFYRTPTLEAVRGWREQNW
jgi:uncharacterized protein YecE (DUF72 family)